MVKRGRGSTKTLFLVLLQVLLKDSSRRQKANLASTASLDPTGTRLRLLLYCPHTLESLTGLTPHTPIQYMPRAYMYTYVHAYAPALAR